MNVSIKVPGEFYVFSSEGHLTTFFVRPDLFEKAIKNNLHGPESGREIHHQLLYGDEKGGYPEDITFPVIFRIIEGKKMRDMLDMRFDGNCFLISEHMKALMEENQITGWKSYPVIIYDKSGNEVSGYHGFTVTGRGGIIRMLRPWEEIALDERLRFILWDKSQWDGSDVFRIGPNLLVISARTKQLFKENKISAASYSPLSEILTVV